MSGNRWLVAGSILGATGVALGAFGAHALQRVASTLGDDPERLLATWETAVRYQMYDSLALLAVGLLSLRGRRRSLESAGWTLLVGTVVFCGLLYAVVLSGITFLGAIVPVGGVLMITGWILLALAGWRQR